MKKEKQDSKKELGKFCLYYGYDTIIASLERKKKQSNIKDKKTFNGFKIQNEICKI